MSTTVSSGLTLTSDFYLRNYYRSNANASKSSYRKQYSTVELNYEDSRALKRAAKRVTGFTFTEDDNVESLANSVKAYVETYNNTLDSANSDSNMKHYVTQLKALSQKYEDKLSAIGIDVEKDGSLTVNTDLISLKDAEDFEELFGEDSEFNASVSSISKKINKSAYNEIFSNLTGTGKQINIVL